MKRARVDEDVIVIWHTKNGRVESTYSKTFLSSVSDFFNGCLKHEDSPSRIDMHLSYPKNVVKNLFHHLDGDIPNVTKLEKEMLYMLIDYLILKSPFDKIETEEADEFCAWCSALCDDSICRAKRWKMINNRQQCCICAEAIQYCDCIHENAHCADTEWVEAFRKI